MLSATRLPAESGHLQCTVTIDAMQRAVFSCRPCSLPQCCSSQPFFFFYFKRNTMDTVPWGGREGSLGGEAGVPEVWLKTFIIRPSEESCPSRDCHASPQDPDTTRLTLGETEP